MLLAQIDGFVGAVLLFVVLPLLDGAAVDGDFVEALGAEFGEFVGAIGGHFAGEPEAGLSAFADLAKQEVGLDGVVVKLADDDVAAVAGVGALADGLVAELAMEAGAA